MKICPGVAGMYHGHYQSVVHLMCLLSLFSQIMNAKEAGEIPLLSQEKYYMNFTRQNIF